MIKKSIFTLLILFLFLMAGCALPQKKVQTKKMEAKKSPPPAVNPAPPKPSRKTLRTDKEGFRLRPVKMEIEAGRPYLPVGAEIFSKAGKVPLVRVIRRLADLKGFSVSWANDINFRQTIDVHIRP